MLIIVMGVSGSGKTTIGQLLSRRLSLSFFDGDDFHSQENIRKMSNSIPLTDADREPWLKKLSSVLLEQSEKDGCILACSALKENYRMLLQSSIKEKILWIHLEGNMEVLQERLQKRNSHFMSPVLLNSQLDTLERPSYALHIPITLSPEKIVEEIIKKVKPSMKALKEFGIIGLGIMGRNLALNLLDKNIQLSVYNRQVSGEEENVAKEFSTAYPQVAGHDDLSDFVASLQKPRKVLIMIKAGEPVDQMIEKLLPLLSPGDLLMDGGNSNYLDTGRRLRFLADKGIMYLGVGISGGEEGARTGASVMPGGSPEAYALAITYLELIAAKDKNHKPCCIYTGPEGAGHFIKMVHNGIEYAEMQLIAEVYEVMRKRMNMLPEKIAAIFDQWKNNGIGSYLLEITHDILLKKEGDSYLLDKILDAAEQKGTGGLSSKTALDLGVPLSTITEAVSARMISALKSQRVKAEDLYNIHSEILQQFSITDEQLKNAYQMARVLNHSIGFNMMHEASIQNHWNLNLSEIARLWTNGCIIRSELMESLVSYFKVSPQLLMHPDVVAQLKKDWPDLSLLVAQGIQSGLSLPVLSASINYFLGYVSASSPANLIQAQRDYFGAHTYRRIDRKDNEYFHSDWKSL